MGMDRRPHVIEYIHQLSQRVIEQHGRSWDVSVLHSVMPMYLYRCERPKWRCEPLWLYEHLESVIKGFGGRSDYALVARLMTEVRSAYLADLSLWEQGRL